ncbi:hypothetical protein PM076_11785 [Halorubrum ezzemoulense]|uniref:DUF8080 domain-containing protein n=1 Tax=Halorubrum ezzemoulense TaxID=337243 RepID=A0ABT4Z293_HALEZ|nr:hypothetical protein [Halorubrum ezzemoulense]MDB2244153.1 hypothetical protein [Halorubrum ezzemoulense]MDB2252400.1 hypothetical protein [Halorubrum ezzemoulense]MDB2277889.1 hypothetical protein [Halorubrum ezzemoulense]MDB2284675.1 hypothetical protein [Halorubrum ezzemoulense]MDB2289516.1 hypothetical protein [Halorubrum ezzemoulense]
MELDWSADREGDASLVGFRVRNDGAVPRRVRIESRLDGPLLPPRRGGVPEAGWDAAGVTAVLDPGERTAFGFAALADPVDPPVEIANVEPVSSDADEAHETAAGGTDLARAAVRDLESYRPPRAAVDGAEGHHGTPDAGGDAGASGSDGHLPGREDAEGDGNAERVAARVERDPDQSATPESPRGSAAGGGVDAWFAAVEARIERAERLTDADLAAATTVVEEVDGLDGAGALDERVAADAERLRAVRDRAAALADRAEESEIPVEALEALA